MSKTDVNLDKLKNTMEKSLRRVPKAEWDYLPRVLLEPGQTRFFVFITGEYLVLDFLDDEEAARITDLRDKGYDPFPGLIKPANISMSAAFALDKSKNIFVQGCTVENMFSFSVGKDSTIVIRDHKQSIKTEEFGVYRYAIKLAYLISFGDEINHSNFYDFLENLVIESFRQWGVSNV